MSAYTPGAFYSSVVAHEVPLFSVVKYSVVLNDTIKLLLDVLLPIWVFSP